MNEATKRISREIIRDYYINSKLYRTRLSTCFHSPQTSFYRFVLAKSTRCDPVSKNPTRIRLLLTDPEEVSIGNSRSRRNKEANPTISRDYKLINLA